MKRYETVITIKDISVDQTSVVIKIFELNSDDSQGRELSLQEVDKLEADAVSSTLHFTRVIKDELYAGQEKVLVMGKVADILSKVHETLEKPGFVAQHTLGTFTQYLQQLTQEPVYLLFKLGCPDETMMNLLKPVYMRFCELKGLEKTPAPAGIM